MPGTMNVILVLAAGGVTALFCGLWWRVMHARLLDVPGERSLHTRPTPTGGGAGLTAALVAAALLASQGTAASATTATVSLMLPAGLLCLAGLLDDLRGLGIWTRLLLQTLCAVWVLVTLGPWPHPGASLLLLAALWIVGFTNAFNFMDGIDGLAASHAAFVGLAGALLLEHAGGHPELVLLLALTGACAAGFLVWNWPPARLFMGDAGSLPLGFLLAALALLAASEGALSAWCWLILWSPFLCDTGITLLMRAAARKPLFQAHREHAYQRLAARGHRPVTLGLLIVDVVWLLPLAWLAAQHPALAPAAAVAALLSCAVVVGLVTWRQAHPEGAPS